MKTNRIYIIGLTMLFISVRLFAQNMDQIAPASLTEKNDFRQKNFWDQITVISIINPSTTDEISNLDALAEEYQYSNITFIAVTDEVNDSIINSLKYQLMHYQYLPETENERTFNKYQTGAIKIFPIQIITNQQGKVYYIKKGNTKNIKHKLSKRIDKILSTSSGPGSLYSQRKTKESYSTEKIWNLPIAKEEVK